jgi:23S rRNA (guanosine2251-2'-O)-methyltransferase
VGSLDHIYGFQPVKEALSAGWEIESISVHRKLSRATSKLISEAESKGIKILKVSRHDLEKLVGTDRHQGIVATVGAKGSCGPSSVEDILAYAAQRSEDPLVLLLDGIQDPQNLGALLRSAHALGVHGVVIPDRRAAKVTPTVVKVSAGAAAHVRIATVSNLKRSLDQLKEAGLWCAAAVMDGEAASRSPLTGPLALVVGAEGAGVRKTVIEACDFKVSIPLGGQFDSLNAAVAGGILIYEIIRQRGENSKIS